MTRAIRHIEAKSAAASRGVRLAIGFGAVAAAYAAVIVEGLQHIGFAGFS